MLEWLFSPIDATRAHNVDFYTAWHGRFMVLAWAFILPAGVFVARFAKIMPGQNWPEEVDNRTWWYTHIALQCIGVAFMGLAVWLIFQAPENKTVSFYHRWAGYVILGLASAQFIAAGLRGTRGGPKHPAPDGSLHGDHYDMTRRRCLFELWHKAMGYGAILLAIATIFMGMWIANGPRWMFIIIALWWAVIFAAFSLLQKRGLTIDTYQAIWGPEDCHPGNHRKPIGWGIRRYQRRE